MTEWEIPLLLDTCAAIWVANADPIAEPASDALDRAYTAGFDTYVSPITAWELGMLVARGRLSLRFRPETWFQRLLAVPGVRLAEMSTDILIRSSFLPGTPPKDPADRIIAATARELGYRLMTRDRVLLAYAEEGHIQAIGC